MRFTAELRDAFLEKLRDTLNVSKAARLVGISTSALYAWRRHDLAFAAAWDEAREEGIDNLEEEARRRAFFGVDEPVFYKGKICGYIKRYSDTLAVFLLRGYRRSVFGDASKVELTGKDGGPVQLNEIELAHRVGAIFARAEARMAVADLV